MSLKIKTSFFKSLTVQLTLGYTFLFIIMTVIMFSVYFLFLSNNIKILISDDLSSDVSECSNIYNSGGISDLIEEFKSEVSDNGGDDKFFQIISPEKELIYTTPLDTWKNIKISTFPFPIDKSSKISTVKTDHREYKVYSITQQLNDGTFLRIGSDFPEFGELQDGYSETFPVVFSLTLPFIIILGWILGIWATRGINKISHIASGINSNSLGKRVEVKGAGEEVEHLADTFNRMLDRIELLVKEQKEVSDNIAHDLRTPLTRIRGISEITLTGEQSIGRYQDLASNIIEESDRLLTIINTMLEISQSETGALTIQKESVDLLELVRNGISLFEPLAEEKNIALELKTTFATIPVRADKTRLQRAFVNLIDNAIKYSNRAGEISVIIEKIEGDLTLTVKDTGIGISKENLHSIFDRFYRGDKSRSTQGTGLGLSLVKAIVDAHGWSIDVESKVGVGSEFWIRF